MPGKRSDPDHPFPPNESRGVKLTTALYHELRKLAAARMAQEKGPQTLQATALLHEAWLRLGGDNQPHWENESHFYAAVASAMRHILVDRARRRNFLRHGGGLERVDGDFLDWEQLDPGKHDNNDTIILVVNDALEELSSGDPETAQVIKLHYFVGLSVVELARLMNLSERTVARRLAFARLLLGERLRREIHE